MIHNKHMAIIPIKATWPANKREDTKVRKTLPKEGETP